MKKIMFDDRFGLTDLVLSGEKTQTRRVFLPYVIWNHPFGQIRLSKVSKEKIKAWQDECKRDFYAMTEEERKRGLEMALEMSPYKVGEEVAVAQSYETLIKDLYHGQEENFADRVLALHGKKKLRDVAGFTNKMFVKAELMPHSILFTGMRMECLQDISDDDVRKEGIVHVEWRQYPSPFSDHYVDHDLWTLPMWRSQFDGSCDEDDPKAWAAKSPKTAFGALIIKMMGGRIWNENPWVYVYDFERLR